MKSHLVFFQCFLCVLLLTCLMMIKTKSRTEVSEAGTFGTRKVQNSTLCDYCNNLYGDLLYE